MEVNTRMIRGFVWNIQSTLCLPSLIKVHFYCSSIVRVLTIMFSFMFSNSPLLWHFFPAFIIAWKAQKIVISIWCRKMDGVFVFVFLFLYEVNSIESLCSLDIVLLCSLETMYLHCDLYIFGESMVVMNDWISRKNITGD